MDADAAIEAAAVMRRAFFNPLCSCLLHGHPCYRYTRWRDEGMSSALFERIARRPGDRCPDKLPQTCVQVATGSLWGLLVIDVDGPVGARIWDLWSRMHDLPRTWCVRTPRGGRQSWFRTPPGRELPYCFLWEGEPGKHEGIEALGDKRLAKIPPSVKVIDGELVPYTWEVGPGDMPSPIDAPGWLLSLLDAAAARAKKSREKPVILPPKPPPRFRPGDLKRSDRRHVVDALSPDEKVSIAQSWGLDIVGRDSSGWLSCRAIGREDRNPSGRFHAETGIYWDCWHSQVLSFFDLAVAMGRYATWMDACDDLGRMAGVCK